MKTMKFCSNTRLWAILSISVFLASSTQCMLACKKAIPRSFGMSGLDKANTNNALCPGNKHNCCDNLDQMKVHKLWHKHVKNLVVGNHKINSAALEMLKQVIKDRKEMDIPAIFKEFKNKKKPSKFFEKRFKDLETKWKKFSHDAISKTSKALKEAIKEFKKKILHLRKGFMCAICSHNSHLYFSPENNSVTYSAAFCDHLIKTNIATLKMKYVDLWDYLLTVAGIFSMLTEEAFFEPADETYYKNFIPIIEKCATSNDIKTCMPLCMEFNLNKFTNLWDGEKIPIENFLAGYNKVWPKLKEKANWDSMFKYNKAKWDALEKEEKAKEEAAKKATQEKAADKKEEKKDDKKDEKKAKELPKVTVSDADLKTLKDNSFKIQFLPNSIEKSLASQPAINVEKVEGADDDDAEYRLFKMVPRPIKFSALEIKIESVGIDLHTVASGNNLETSPEQIIELIWAKGSEIKPLDEPISDDVKALLMSIGFKEIAHFVNDEGIKFDRLLTKRPRKSTLKKKKSILNIVWGDEKKEAAGDDAAEAEKKEAQGE